MRQQAIAAAAAAKGGARSFTAAGADGLVPGLLKVVPENQELSRTRSSNSSSVGPGAVVSGAQASSVEGGGEGVAVGGGGVPLPGDAVVIGMSMSSNGTATLSRAGTAASVCCERCRPIAKVSRV